MTASLPSIAGIPLDFILFAAVLAGVALFHHHSLRVALIGLATITLYKIAFSSFHGSAGLGGLVAHLGKEWVLIVNLLLLIIGFSLLARHFEESRVPLLLPSLLPDDWKGGFAMLALVFVLSSFLDNIAAAMIGGTMATMMWIDGVRPGQVFEAYLAAIPALLFFGVIAARQQHAFQPIMKD